jgi:phage tail sheath protein FI
MAFQVSPGVEVKEIDATNVIPAVSTSIGGSVGFFTKGPIDTPITVSSEKQLVETFGEPTAETFKYFGPMAGFLKYGNALKVIRVVGSGVLNATNGTAQLIKSKDDYDSKTLAATAGDFIARNAGLEGNAIEVQVCLANATSFAAWTHASLFGRAPGTSNFAVSKGNSDALDEMHVAVIDKTGAISGVPGTVLETFEGLSQGTNAKNDDGSTNFFKDVINNGSQYIFVGYIGAAWLGGKALQPAAITQASTSYTAADDTGPQSTAGQFVVLSGGVDGTVANSSIPAGLDLLKDAETLDVNLLFATADLSTESAAIAIKLQEVAEHRKDCVAFVSPPVSLTDGSTTPSAATIAADATLSGRNSSYVVLDSTSIKVYDKYSDSYSFINASGHIAGLCANTDRVADAWFSPAGETRGQLLGVTKLGFNPNKADRDTLYKASVNPLVSFPGQGTMLFGDKTSQFRASAFDRINVRRLFIVLEKAISTASKSMLFEFNDEFTRANFRNMVEPFLRDVKGRRGITDFLVICDETNNTGNVIDSNQFVADIFIKPARSINFIKLNFIATRTGVEFSEIAGQ